MCVSLPGAPDVLSVFAAERSPHVWRLLGGQRAALTGLALGLLALSHILTVGLGPLTGRETKRTGGLGLFSCKRLSGRLCCPGVFS